MMPENFPRLPDGQDLEQKWLRYFERQIIALNNGTTPRLYATHDQLREAQASGKVFLHWLRTEVFNQSWPWEQKWELTLALLQGLQRDMDTDVFHTLTKEERKDPKITAKKTWTMTLKRNACVAIGQIRFDLLDEKRRLDKLLHDHLFVPKLPDPRASLRTFTYEYR